MTPEEFNAWIATEKRRDKTETLRDAREVMQILLSKPNVWPSTLADAREMLRDAEEWAAEGESDDV